ncbi:MAG: Nif3-like dinuclear metal center hexameric protein, partial [Bacteroidetes bacterium]
MPTTIRDIIGVLEQVAPPAYQEGYDNAGLLVGDANRECTGVITCLDSTEAVIDEAVAKGCNLVVAHHPIVFKGLKRFTGRTYVERVVIKAIQTGVAIYAIHTNLDNVYAQGVNAKIAERLGLENTRILAPKANLKRLFVNTPQGDLDLVKEALEKAVSSPQAIGNGLQQLTLGVRPDAGSSWQLEVVFPAPQQAQVLAALAKFPDLAYTLDSIENPNPLTGSGMLGELPRPLKPMNFLKRL